MTMTSETLKSCPFCGGATIECYRALADGIEREVEREWTKLPVDADGVTIHVGDRLDNFGEQFTCEWIEYDTDNVSIGYATSYGELPPAFAPDECEHVKTRTIEDVLTDYAANSLTLEEAAAELRVMMEVDE